MLKPGWVEMYAHELGEVPDRDDPVDAKRIAVVTEKAWEMNWSKTGKWKLMPDMKRPDTSEEDQTGAARPRAGNATTSKSDKGS